MANQANKRLAIQNARIVANHRLFAMGLHGFFILMRLVLRLRAFSTGMLIKYLLTTALSGFLQFTLEKTGRARYNPAGELLSAGQDLNQAGLTEWMWDVIYVCWLGQALAALGINRGFWVLWAVPAYAVFKVGPMAARFLGLGNMFGGRGAAAEAQEEAAPAMSKRQQKMEKRGGQKIRYR
ncbi:DUF788-domain-containing protein [Saitoella complicata NRRL Y-17804]|uniref:DUF788-domain-containing protein n=1 Tax=Saitoella complicata (strain BCRC 22490 / CBS 7301 / JCM 7358 / NBRC 10748 / NRRL Y-17804) TaxID=698492 RepID=A0A0E9NAW7_SAICN|nr:DUF788-domain-containing protein [Saitoella complicata NRRL Y-17804]ODQ53855.1 DUF788-domain-containing protein [Saitoella complicata NRRL Y-17804]GAO46938.1 hypothetical protein G7K_1156-t1 [Saitoella complicata NRRL Y-17804]